MNSPLEAPPLANPPVGVVVWASGGEWGPALVQLAQGRFRVVCCDQYEEFCGLAASSPYAVRLWEVNLSNWEERARRLAEFVRQQPQPSVAIAPVGLPPAAEALFEEFGALNVVRRRLEGMRLVQIALRRLAESPPQAPSWRNVVATPIPWLQNHTPHSSNQSAAPPTIAPNAHCER